MDVARVGHTPNFSPGGSRMARPFVSRSLAMLAAGAIALASMSAAKPASQTASAPPSQAVIDSKPWTGDFDGMLERRRIRMLVPYSRTLFFVENGHGAWPHGGSGA